MASELEDAVRNVRVTLQAFNAAHEAREKIRRALSSADSAYSQAQRAHNETLARLIVCVEGAL